MNSEFTSKVLNVSEVFNLASESLILYLKIVTPPKMCFLFFWDFLCFATVCFVSMISPPYTEALFRTLPKIKDGVFCKKRKGLLAVYYFRRTLHLKYFAGVLNTSLLWPNNSLKSKIKIVEENLRFCLLGMF